VYSLDETCLTDGLQELVLVGSEMEEQRKLVEANAALLDLDGELETVHQVLKERYARRFPELASFDLDAVSYARVVLALGTEEAWLQKAAGLVETVSLPPALQMIVSVTAATTKGSVCDAEWLESTIFPLARLVVAMDTARAELLKAIQQRMDRLCPNVAALVGVAVAAQLVGAAGGIRALSAIPANNIQVMGRGKRTNLVGLSSRGAGVHSGYIAQTPLVVEASMGSVDLEVRAQRMLSAKVAIASRIDADPRGNWRDGSFGAQLREEIVAKLEKIAEPPPLKAVKPLPPPDAARKKRRGGKRARKLKELYAETELRRQKNRMAFGPDAEAEMLVGDRMEGLGMLGAQTGEGKLRMATGSGSGGANGDSSRLREYIKKQAEGKINRSSSHGEQHVITLPSKSAEPTKPVSTASGLYDRTAGFRKAAK
jgi:U4/U6 small nuclear ribonucleoprotein PRP31